MPDQPFAERRIAITGASGSLGKALMRQLHAQGASLIALTSSHAALELQDSSGNSIPLQQVSWCCGEEEALKPVLEQCDVLVINHGYNSHGDRSPEAVLRSLEVNALSSWRLLELMGQLAHQELEPERQREVWINTSEAEIQAAVSPLYEISKRLQGQLLSLRSLDLASSKLRIRRLVLGPFRSALNPIGVMSADFVAGQILRQVRWNCGLVIVTPNPLTYLLMPLSSISRWLYFKAVSRGEQPVRNHGR